MEIQPKRVLILDTAWLGDVIFTTSLIGAVKEAWPQTELHVLVAPRGEPLVKYHPDIFKVWVWDKSDKEKSLIALMTLAKTLRVLEFDVLLNAHPSFRSRLITYLSGAKIRVGYRGFGSRLAFTHVIENSLAVEPNHAIRRVALLRVLNQNARVSPLKVGLSAEGVAVAKQLLNENGAGRKPILALVPGSARLTKVWGAEHFSSIAKRWRDERGGISIVIGGKAETDLVTEICSRTGDGAVAMIGVSLETVAAVLSKSTSAIGNDTGVSLLAIAAGCPKVLVLYGSTQVNYHFSSPHSAIAAGVPCCLPRTGHGEKNCKWQDSPWCMGEITEERVWKKLNDHE